MITLSAVGYATVGRIGNDVASASSLALGDAIAGTSGEKKVAKHGQATDGATDILLVGSDSRADAQGNPLTPEEIAMLRAGDEENDNTDTLMLIRVPNDGSSATAISIPRDTYIHDPQMGNMKINGVYSAYKAAKQTQLLEQGITDQKELIARSTEAGRAALIRAISRLSGVTVDHYAEIGLLGFVLLTDAVGGVEVCLLEPTQDEFSQANFPAGRQTLNGPDALSYVRQRHGLPRGDLDRITRQQAYMASLVNKMLSNGTLTNTATLAQLADAIRRSVIIDEGWDIMSFANQLQNLAGGRVKFTTIPVTSIDGVGDYGESVVTVDTKEVHDFFDTLLSTATAAPEATEEPADTAADDGKKPLIVHTLNASLATGLAARVAQYLADDNYPIGDISNAPEGLYDRSQIVAADPDDREVKQLAKLLGSLPITQSDSLEPGEAVVVVHGDYVGPKADTEYELPPAVVGQPGEEAVDDAPAVIDAGGDGPRCVY
nr:LCP family protein [Corynebacterium choanae]